jgi:hypothetical protein
VADNTLIAEDSDEEALNGFEDIDKLVGKVSARAPPNEEKKVHS